MCSQAVYLSKSNEERERMKRQTRCSKVVELRGEMNRKAPPLSLATDSRGIQLEVGPLGMILGPLRRPGSCWLEVRIPTGAGPRLGMASVYTKYLSTKGTGGGGGSREATPSLAGSPVS